MSNFSPPTRDDHRGMILSPLKWPHLYLPLKRGSSSGREIAILTTATQSDSDKLVVMVNQTIFGMALGEVEQKVYADVDALLDDGWVVD